MNVYEHVVGRWKAQGIARNPAAGINALDQFEKQQQLKLPSALRRLLLLANGMRASEYDEENQIRFWPLEELASVSTCAPEFSSPHYENCLVFADHSMWSHAYAASLDSGVVVMVGEEEPIFVTGSLESFFSMYVNNAPALFPRVSAESSKTRPR